VVVTDRVTGRREQVHAGDRVRFIRPYLDRGFDGGYVANGTAGHVLNVDPKSGRVAVGCDDGRSVTVRPEVHEDAQPLRLGYASHALKLQGGQAPVVLVLPGGWQTSRQSAYSMVTRCVEELHVYVDAETQQTGPHRDNNPIQALGDRWTRDAGKIAATLQRDNQQPDAPLGRSTVDEDLVVAPAPAWELATSRGLESAGGHEIPNGLGIDP
jgi:hypothetical protein